MTELEHLQLFKRLFPLIHLTIGEMLQAKVYQDGNQYAIAYAERGSTRYMTVDFGTQVHFINPMAPSKPFMFQLNPEQTDAFWQRLYEMLANQPRIVNGLNQGLELIELKPFNADDWSLWSGAEPPPDSEPLINYEVKAQGFPDDQCLATILVDATGIDIYLFTEDTLGQVECWYELPVEWPAGKAIIDQMSQPITPNLLRRYGFIKVS